VIRDRRLSGLVTNIDVNQQSVQVATAAALLPLLHAEARAQVHALGVLIGRQPETLRALWRATLPRRPDVLL
jgi:outer membrane protein TolC